MKKEKEEARAKVDAAMIDVPAGVRGGEIAASLAAEKASAAAPAVVAAPVSPAAAAPAAAPAAKVAASAAKAPLKWGADLSLVQETHTRITSLLQRTL